MQTNIKSGIEKTTAHQIPIPLNLSKLLFIIKKSFSTLKSCCQF